MRRSCLARPQIVAFLCLLIGMLTATPVLAVTDESGMHGSPATVTEDFLSKVIRSDEKEEITRTGIRTDSTRRGEVEENRAVRTNGDKTTADATNSSVSEDEAIEFIKDVWGVTDIADGVLRETLPVEYDGIPFKDWIGALIEAPSVVDALGEEDYEEAAEEAARIGSQFAISRAIEQAGLSGVAAFASAAYWPIDASISAFRDAAADAAFENELDPLHSGARCRQLAR